MRIYLISDTHFGHWNLIEYEDRPKDFNELIIKNWNEIVKDEDLIIHLGDLHLSGLDNYHKWVGQLRGRKILVLGNHDNRSKTFYMNNYFDFVCERFVWKIYGYSILFSHCPMLNFTEDINIFGHLHSNKSWYLKDSPKHRLFTLEHHYKPISLRKFLGV